MALTRDQRRAMERSIHRMNTRQTQAMHRPDGPVPMTPDTTEGFAPEGTLSEAERLPDDLNLGVEAETLDARVKAVTMPDEAKVRRAAGTMWWAAQSPAIADDQRERLLEARDMVLQESALA